MFFGGAPSPPPTPDPYKTAAAQQMANVEVAIANSALQNADEIRPDGNVSFEQFGTPITTHTYDANGNITGSRDVYRWRKTVTLTGKGQTIFDQQQDLSVALNEWAIAQAGILGNQLSAPLSATGLQGLITPPTTAPVLDQTYPTPLAIQTAIGATDLTDHIATVRDAIDSRLQYQIDLDRANKENDLANKGIFVGSEAYERTMYAFDKQSTDARLQAYLKAGEEQSRMIQMEALIAGFKNQAASLDLQLKTSSIDTKNRRILDVFKVGIDLSNFVLQFRQAELQERITIRSQVINEVSSLMHGGQIQVPQFQGFRAGHISDTPVAQSVYQSAAMDMQKWQVQVQQQQSMMGGILGLAGNLISLPFMFSSSHLKDIIEEDVLSKIDQLEIALWRYTKEAQQQFNLDGKTHIGPLAEQWAELFGGDGVTIGTHAATEVVLRACKAMDISPIDLFGSALLILKGKMN